MEYLLYKNLYRLKHKISSCYVLVSMSYFIYEYAYVGSEAIMARTGVMEISTEIEC